MGRALEMITGFNTAPGVAAYVALVAAAGDAFAIRNGVEGKKIRLLQMWAQNNVAGAIRIRSPRLHDNTRGICERVNAVAAVPLLGMGSEQLMYPNDVFIAENMGSAVAGNIESGFFLFEYEDLPGCDAHLIDLAALAARGVNVVTQECAIVTGAGGGYTGPMAFNATFDILKADTEYALLGITGNIASGAICLRGPDTSNLRIGVPGDLIHRDIGRDWFRSLTMAHGRPLIPVINYSNKAGTTVDAVQNQGAGTVVAVFNLVELAPK